jgi:TetR/AcrR family transcriptional repressor of nem operon
MHIRMPRPRSFDEDAVLDQAVELFWERGYEGTSLADLETHLGLGRQSLYNTFGDKQTLFLKSLEHYEQTVVEGALAHLNPPRAGLDAIRGFFRATVESLTTRGPRRGCLMANTILERGSQNAEALLRCNHARAELERAVRRALVQAKRRGELSDSLDVEATTTLLVTQTYGLAVLAKSGATAGELHAALEVLLAGLE